MIKKLLLFGTLFIVGGLQAITLRFTHHNETMSCFLDEMNQVKFENGLSLTVVDAQQQEDGSVVTNLVVEIDGQEHAVPTVIVSVTEPAVLTCQSPESTDVITIALENVVTE